jgi:SAM-dependent methyltransferase
MDNLDFNKQERPSGGGRLPRMYNDFAAWWPVLSDPADYADEAAFLRPLLQESGTQPAGTLLELGSGGGHLASHLKAHFHMTLVDPSPGMLQVSRAMRTARLGRRFDRVLIHDAIMYMLSEADLRQAMQTCHIHLRPGGAAVLVPDCVRESFEPNTEHGGHDSPGRSLRYLEWSWDPDPNDSTFLADYAYLLREEDQEVQIAYDRHVNGLFGRGDWLQWLAEVGFQPRVVTDQYGRDVFIGVRPVEEMA